MTGDTRTIGVKDADSSLAEKLEVSAKTIQRISITCGISSPLESRVEQSRPSCSKSFDEAGGKSQF